MLCVDSLNLGPFWFKQVSLVLALNCLLSTLIETVFFRIWSYWSWIIKFGKFLINVRLVIGFVDVNDGRQTAADDEEKSSGAAKSSLKASYHDGVKSTDSSKMSSKANLHEFLDTAMLKSLFSRK
jgi:hypothetical protein